MCLFNFFLVGAGSGWGGCNKKKRKQRVDNLLHFGLFKKFSTEFQSSELVFCVWSCVLIISLFSYIRLKWFLGSRSLWDNISRSLLLFTLVDLER